MSDDQDWRMEAELDVPDAHRALEGLMGRIRPHSGEHDELRQEVAQAVPDDVVVTHDGRLLFAYANSEQGLQTARATIMKLLQEDGIAASSRVSVWDHAIDDWRQVDPPPAGDELRREQREERDAGSPETRTLVAHAGAWIKGSFEQSMLAYAEQLGLECKIVEKHPHLPSTQVAFTVTGPTRRIDEFAAGLRSEGARTVRSEADVLNPL